MFIFDHLIIMICNNIYFNIVFPDSDRAHYR